MNFEIWLKALAMAALGGASSGAAAGLTGGNRSIEAILMSVATGALIAAGAYLKQSPLAKHEGLPTPQDPPRDKGL